MSATLNELFPEAPYAQSPAELYLAFGPDDRVVKVTQAGSQYLAHVTRGGDKLWRADCGPETFLDDPDGSSIYAALRRLVDHCPALVELEP